MTSWCQQESNIHPSQDNSRKSLADGGGDTHPFEREAKGKSGHELAERTGVALGANALSIFRAMEPTTHAGPSSLQVAEDTLQFALPARARSKPWA